MTQLTPASLPGLVRRALTEAELTAIIADIDTAHSTVNLLATALRSVFDTLLAEFSLSLSTLPDRQQLDPGQFHIPTTQWKAIMGAAVGRAAAWGTGAEVAMELIAMLPRSYDDLTAPVPDTPQVDHRPDLLTLQVTRDAVDVIAAATEHVHALAACYGPASEQHLSASSSWLSALSRLLSMGLGASSRVCRDGDLSLLVHTASGFTYALIFHGATRHCIAGAGCTATIADDGTAHALSSTSVVAEHNHEPSFPLDAPRPGSWSVHS